MHKIVKIGLSVGAAFVMNISLAFGMEEDDTSRGTVQSKLKEPPLTLPSSFEKAAKEIRHLIVGQAVVDQCSENKSPVNVGLVCKEWREFVTEEMKVGHAGWKAWYGVIGHEDIYERFLKGVLVYRPNEGSDVGKIELPIAALKNPIESSFDLSNCENTGKYLSINTGYRKVQTHANANKVEIWFTPRFLVDKEMPHLAKNHHMQEIRGNWDGVKAPIGIFWTWGGWDAKDQISYCDYLTTESMGELGSENLLKKWQKSGQANGRVLAMWCGGRGGWGLSHFVCELSAPRGAYLASD